MYRDYMESPLGSLEIEASSEGLSQVKFVDSGDFGIINKNTYTDLSIRELHEYFNSGRRVFSVPTDVLGSDFQKSVWRELQAIEYACSCSYSDIASALNNPKAVRAVGSANGRNPIPIIVPCHRVIGKDGSLAGYAGGLERKRWLLRHEGIHFTE
ncbi:MAG: methylated-DNA-[protein]-cysteine S-methyltransferase [Flavobacteriales bacterium]|jgi:methylated-DNA-[protein]-cysteine S-methyltransferase